MEGWLARARMLDWPSSLGTPSDIGEELSRSGVTAPYGAGVEPVLSVMAPSGAEEELV
jgi:hypothetical protein